MLPAFFLLPLLIALAAAANCNCGFSVNPTQGAQHQVFTDYLETDFTQSTLDGWLPQDYKVEQADARGPYGKLASPDNVVASTQGLQLLVRPDVNGLIPMAEVDSKRTDMLYGSFRVRMKMSSVNGTCGAFFWFWNNTQEIDMEFLSRQLTRGTNSPVNLVMQSPKSEAQGWNAQGTAGFDLHPLQFQPEMDFHEYRFDWIPGKVSFYADNQLLKVMTEDIPTSPGHVVLNHWSNGDSGWSGGPPREDAVVIVTHAHMYFNSTDANMRKLYQKNCPKPERSKICQINDDIRIPLIPIIKPSGSSASSSNQPHRPSSTPSTSSIPSTSSTTSTNGTVDAAGTAEKQKATSKGHLGFIIAGAIFGLFIVLFVACMITVRHWASWRNKVSSTLGFKRVTSPPNSGPNSSTPSTLEMQHNHAL